MNITGIQTRVYGPQSAASAEAEGAGFVVPADTARQLVEVFTSHLSTRRNGPVQLLIDVADIPPTVVNVARYYGAAAVAHVLRAPPAGEVPALVSVLVMLPGTDADADRAAIEAVESSRDKSGAPLPLPPAVYASLRADADRPLLSMLVFSPEAVTDASLRMIALCLAQAFFASIAK